MNQEEHIMAAQGLIQKADQEFRNGGNELIAAELLWGAFAHCLIAFAQNEGLPHDSHGAFRQTARMLATKTDLDQWQSDFGAAEQMHLHFYHGHIQPRELRSHRRTTTRAIHQLLLMLRTTP